MDLHPRFASVLPVFINASLKKLIDRNETELIEKLFKCNVQLASIRGLLSHIENSYAQELKTMDPLLIALTKRSWLFLHRYKDHHNKICYLMSSQQLDHRQIKSVADSQEYSPLTNRIKASKEVMQDIVSKEDKALPLKRNLGFSLQE